MSEWKQITVNEVCEKVCVGFVGTYSNSQTNSVDGYPMIRTMNLTERGIVFDNLTYVTKNFHEKNKKSQLKYGDILIARHGDNGKACMFKENFESNCLNVVIVRPDKNKVNPNFFLYQFNSPLVRNEISSYSTGSVQDVINTKDIGRLELYFPSLPEQESIAEVLSSLEDKIDLLHRNNKTLEQMAETLFRHWFVEEAEVNSDIKINMEDVIESVSITHKFTKGGAIFLNTSDIYEGTFLTNQFTKKEILPGQAKKSIQNEDILFSEIRPSNGRWAYVNFSAEDYVVSTKLMVLRSKGKISSAFIYFYLTQKSVVDYLQMIAESRSGTFPQITFEQIKPLKINIPSEKIFKDAEAWCKSAIEKMLFNKEQIKQLESLRDTLLPKLMSGTVTVEK